MGRKKCVYVKHRLVLTSPSNNLWLLVAASDRNISSVFLLQLFYRYLTETLSNSNYDFLVEYDHFHIDRNVAIKIGFFRDWLNVRLT